MKELNKIDYAQEILKVSARDLYDIAVDMAKQICMIQRTEQDKKYWKCPVDNGELIEQR